MIIYELLIIIDECIFILKLIYFDVLIVFSYYFYLKKYKNIFYLDINIYNYTFKNRFRYF